MHYWYGNAPNIEASQLHDKKISDPNILLLIYEQAVAHVAIAVRIDVNVVDYSITATTRIGGSNNKNEQWQQVDDTWQQINRESAAQ